MEELYDELSAQVDEIDQDLADVESDVYDDEDYDIEDYDDEDDDYDFDDEENPFYEVTCDSCGRSLMFPKMSFLKAKSSVLTVVRTLSLIFLSFSAMRKMTSVMPIVHHAAVVRTQKNN